MRPDDGQDGEDGDGGGGGGGLFAGVRFALHGFNAIFEEQARSKLVRHGGADAGGYGPADRCTHLVVDETTLYDDPACVAARAMGSKVVTKLWMDHSILNGTKPENDHRLIYRPVKDTKGIPGFQALNICCTGFSSKETKDIEIIVRMAGACFHDNCKMYEASHIICREFAGADYELSVKMKMIAVNYLWLKECVIQWSLVPVGNFTKRRLAVVETTPTSSRNKTSLADLMPQSDTKQSIVTPTMPSRINREYMRLVKNYSEHTMLILIFTEMLSPLDPKEGRVALGMKSFELAANTCKRTSDRKCKRALYLGGSPNCIPEVRIGGSSPEASIGSSKSTEEDLSTCLEPSQAATTSVETVTLQAYAWQRKLSKLCNAPGCSTILRLSLAETKLIFLRCFVQLASQHKKNKSLSGKLDASMFIIWLTDNTVTLETSNELHTYTDKRGTLDYLGFVSMIKSLYHGKQIPLDVSKWLQVISKGVGYWLPEQIANHIVMTDDAVAFGSFQSMYHSFLEFEKDKNTAFMDMVNSEDMEKHKTWKLKYSECSLLRQAYNWKDHLGRLTFYEANIKGLFRLVRNCWEHPARLLQGYLLCILLATHPDLLPDVQKALSDAGYLKHLRM